MTARKMVSAMSELVVQQVPSNDALDWLCNRVTLNVLV